MWGRQSPAAARFPMKSMCTCRDVCLAMQPEDFCVTCIIFVQGYLQTFACACAGSNQTDQVENIQLNLHLHVPFLSFFLHQMRTQQRRYGAEQIEWMLQMVMAKDDVCAHTKQPRGLRFVAMASHLPEVQKSQNNLYPQFPLYNEAVNAPTLACTMPKWMLKWTITRALTPNRWTQPCSRTFI